MWYDNTQLPLYVEAQSYVCCWWPAPDCFFYWCPCLCTHEHYTNSGMLISAVCDYQCCPFLHAIGSRLLLTYTVTSLMHCSGLYSSFVNSMWAVGLFKSCIEKPGDTHPSPRPCARVSHGPLLQRNAVNATILSVFNLLSAAIWLSVRNNLMFVPFFSSPWGKKVMSPHNPAWVPDWLY